MKKIYLIGLLCGLFATTAFAGNPDRQGESGAVQLLMNPWAPSAGLHTNNTSSISGVEAMRLNIAGMGRIQKTQVMAGYTNYLQGTDLALQSVGIASKVGENGAFGLSIMSLDFGDIPVTTDAQPEGTGALLDISFLNIGFGYSHVFENKVSVGVLFRGVSESTSDISSFGFAIDAGVQYVTGEKDQFKFGISLRNVGSRMTYGGQGLATTALVDGEEFTLNQRVAGFEMPSVLNLGASYDLLSNLEKHRITLHGNFTANSFGRDQLGAAIEYAFNEQFILRGGYRSDIESSDLTEEPLYDGLSAGASVKVPLSKDNRTSAFSIDYAYRNTRIYNGTHNIGITFDF
ncbi:MAG: PorV/PorQ family protein [Bacteroidota bacterium]